MNNGFHNRKKVYLDDITSVESIGSREFNYNYRNKSSMDWNEHDLHMTITKNFYMFDKGEIKLPGKTKRV